MDSLLSPFIVLEVYIVTQEFHYPQQLPLVVDGTFLVSSLLLLHVAWWTVCVIVV